MTGAKGKYIEAAYDLLVRDGLEGVSIRKVADELGCSSTALYRHFPDVNELIAVASMRFLRSYIEDARVLSKVDLNPLELNLQLWECLAFYSFEYPEIYENLFYGEPTGRRYSKAVSEYFTQYPDDLMGLKDFLFDMFMNATIDERDSILLERAAENGMISEEGASYLCKIGSYLYRGMRASLRGETMGDEKRREATREFMQLLIRSYTTQLKEGYSILVVKPDFMPETATALSERASYRVKTISRTKKPRSKKKSVAESA